MELDPGAPLIAYGLELRGARTLERCGKELVRWKKEYTRRTEWFLEHHLMISNFRCVLELALKASPNTELVTWNQGRDAWFQVMIPGGRRHFARLAPDAYFSFRSNNVVRHVFLEADRGTEEHRRIIDKLVRYWWYLQADRFADPNGGRPRVNVVFVTIGEERRLALMQTLELMRKPNRATHGGKGIFSFFREDDFDIHNPIGVWNRLAWHDGGIRSEFANAQAPPPQSVSAGT